MREYTHQLAEELASNIFPRSIHHNSGESLASSNGHDDGDEGNGEFWEEGEGAECCESENEDHDDPIIEIEDW